MTDRACALAHHLVLDAIQRSAALARHFIKEGLVHSDEPAPIIEPIPLPWTPLEPDELSLGFAMAVNVVRGTGFDAEADRLAVLGRVAGHG
ncbi:hypothetical protein [Methylobacterium soli]|uniref:Uncharacterized protein n=1 Tax=Methylobacterium soli TaxID=553447 RepID=A0A6L3SS69_9HYPH|nr:hypothetical protein [Methylobacterium soli]KAB1075911.1 hypothetical protein F6X53_24070 [Methylobacterium soli]GJE41849.1 hypothetical protein AEGHOMDF_1018 [Methylobacterium soli]